MNPVKEFIKDTNSANNITIYFDGEDTSNVKIAQQFICMAIDTIPIQILNNNSSSYLQNVWNISTEELLYWCRNRLASQNKQYRAEIFKKQPKVDINYLDNITSFLTKDLFEPNVKLIFSDSKFGFFSSVVTAISRKITFPANFFNQNLSSKKQQYSKAFSVYNEIYQSTDDVYMEIYKAFCLINNIDVKKITLGSNQFLAIDGCILIDNEHEMKPSKIRISPKDFFWFMYILTEYLKLPFNLFECVNKLQFDFSKGDDIKYLNQYLKTFFHDWLQKLLDDFDNNSQKLIINAQHLNINDKLTEIKNRFNNLFCREETYCVETMIDAKDFLDKEIHKLKTYSEKLTQYDKS